MSDLEQVTAGAGAADVVNTNFRAVQPAALYGRRSTGSGGLYFSYYGGYLGGNSVADGEILIAASETTIYVVAALATGVVTSSTSNTNWNNTTDYMRIGVATTGASTITGFVDRREAYTGGSGGGGGGGSSDWGDLTNVPDPIVDIAALTDPGADRILFWDDSAGEYTHLTVGTNLTITGTTIDASGGGGGGLTNFTESADSSSPNATVPQVRLAANNAATDVDTVGPSPKGFGSFSLCPADASTANGNKRGSYAVDLQLSRSNAAYIASGSRAFLGGGTNNTGAGSYCAVFGSTNNCQGDYGFLAGRTNTTSATDAHALGRLNNATQANAIAIGTECEAAGFYSFATGYGSSTGSLLGGHSFASGYYSAAGDAQTRRAVYRAATTNATPQVMNTQSSSDGATNVLVLPTGSAYIVTAKGVARQASTGDMAVWTIKFAIKNVSGTCSLVGTPSVVQDFSDSGAATWTIAVTANNTLKAPTLTATGEASKSIKWTALIESVEVVG